MGHGGDGSLWPMDWFVHLIGAPFHKKVVGGTDADEKAEGGAAAIWAQTMAMMDEQDEMLDDMLEEQAQMNKVPGPDEYGSIDGFMLTIRKGTLPWQQ